MITVVLKEPCDTMVSLLHRYGYAHCSDYEPTGRYERKIHSCIDLGIELTNSFFQSTHVLYRIHCPIFCLFYVFLERQQVLGVFVLFTSHLSLNKHKAGVCCINVSPLLIFFLQFIDINKHICSA